MIKKNGKKTMDILVVLVKVGQRREINGRQGGEDGHLENHAKQVGAKPFRPMSLVPLATWKYISQFLCLTALMCSQAFPKEDTPFIRRFPHLFSYILVSAWYSTKCSAIAYTYFHVEDENKVLLSFLPAICPDRQVKRYPTCHGSCFMFT